MDHPDYKESLVEYRRLLTRIRGLRERAEANPAMKERLLPTIYELDDRRNALHDKIKKTALQEGKNEAEVNFDILLGDSSLHEYTLPEFTIAKVDDFFVKNEGAYLEIISEPHDEKAVAFPDRKKLQYVEQKGEFGQKNDDRRLKYAFIPFGQDSSWHLFDTGKHFSKLPDSLERARRALRVCKEVGAEIGNIMIPETFHRGERWFGIFFPVSQYEKVIDFMQRNREEISIRSEFFDKNQIKEDWGNIIEEEMSRVISEESSTESIPYLLNRYRNSIKALPISEEERIVAYELIDRKIEKEKIREIERETDEKIGGEIIERYSDLSNLPSRESHHRKT